MRWMERSNRVGSATVAVLFAVIDTMTRECPPLLSANRMHGKGGVAVADDALIAANRRRMRTGRDGTS